MGLTNKKEEFFDPIPRLKSSPIPINFISFDLDEWICFKCGSVYEFAYLYFYCVKCLFRYIKDIPDNNTYLDILMKPKSSVQCNKHETIGSHTRIQEWCDCFEILHFRQMVSEYSKSIYLIQDELNCNLCGKLVQNILCSNCYLISFGWIESLYKTSIPILYLPWWDSFNKCLVCKFQLKVVSDSQKWCSGCYVVYTGCRYCLTTNIIFGLSEQSQCRKCKRITFLDINSIDTISGNNDIDAFLCTKRINHINEIVDYIENIERDFNPLDVYTFINEKIDLKSIIKWIPYTQLKNFKEIARGGFNTIYRATWSDDRTRIDGKLGSRTVAIKRFSHPQDFSKYFLNEVIIFNGKFRHRWTQFS